MAESSEELGCRTGLFTERKITPWQVMFISKQIYYFFMIVCSLLYWELGDNNIKDKILIINKINWFMTLFVFIVYAGNKILVSLLYRGDADKFLLE